MIDKSIHVLSLEVQTLMLQKQASRQSGGLFDNMPDVKRMMESKSVVNILWKLQEFIWTVRRITLKKRHTRSTNSTKKSLVIKRKAKSNDVPRIYFDITSSIEGLSGGGIKRVALRLAEEVAKNANATLIVFKDGRPMIWNYETGAAQEEYLPKHGDIYAILDHFWDAFNFHAPALREMRAKGVVVATCIYDLIPLDYPALVELDLLRKQQDFIRPAVEGSDMIFSISNASIQETLRYLKNEDIPTDGKETGWFSLGSPPTSRNSFLPVREEVKSLFLGRRTFLSVGSIMPHKAHLVAIAAFEVLWKDPTADISYVIIGEKYADNAIDVWIERHAEFGKRLFRISDAADHEVSWAYDNAVRLIQPSIAEGFGLPVIEAIRHGLPVIASDIAVFREIGGDSLRYFQCGNSTELLAEISECGSDKNLSKKTLFVDWQDSAQSLIALLASMNAEFSRCEV